MILGTNIDKAKQSKAKQNKTNHNKTKQNKKQNPKTAKQNMHNVCFKSWNVLAAKL